LTLLEPRNEKEIVSKLRELPEEKRRVVVLVGRHPGEGSTRIAQKNHREWEKLGAAAVKLPKSMTPDAFWRSAVRAFDADAHTARNMVERLPPSDGEIIEIVTKRFGVPVINLHGAPHQEERESKQLLRLFFSPIGPLNKPRLEKLAKRLKANKLSREDVRILVERDLQRMPHPHAVLAEHFFSAERIMPRSERKTRTKSALLMLNLRRQVEKAERRKPALRKRFQQIQPDYFIGKPQKVPELSKQHQTALKELIILLAGLQREGVFTRERK